MTRASTPTVEPVEGLRSATLIGRNFAFRLGAQVLSALINLAAMVLLGNHLAAEGYGEYAFYYALIPLIASLSDLGVGVMVTREMARHPERSALCLGDALIVKGVVSGLILAGVAVVSWQLVDPGSALLICLTAATAVIDFSQDVSVWVFRATERLDLEAALLLTSQVLWLGALAVGIATHAPLAALLGAATFAFLVRFTIGAIVVSRMLKPSFAPRWRRIRVLMLQGLPFGLAMFGVVLYGRVGVLMLKGLAGAADVAYFNVAYMLSQPLGFVSSALSMAAFPALSRKAKHGDDAVSRALSRAAKYQLIVTMPVMVGLFLLGEKLVPMLFRNGDYVHAGVALQIMSLGLVFVFLNLMARYVLTAIDRQRHYLHAVILGLLTNVVLCGLLIPKLRFMGACAAWVSAEVVIFIVCQIALTQYVPFTRLLSQGWRPFTAALGMGALLLALHAEPVFALVPVGALAYVGLLFLLRAFTPEELRVFRGVYISFHLPGSGYLKRVEGRS